MNTDGKKTRSIACHDGTYLVLVGDTVALAGDRHHLRPESGGDELSRVVGGVRLSLNQGSYRRAVRAVQSLVMTRFQMNKTPHGRADVRPVLRISDT